ncbi:hypothetical protein QQX98_007327 [Neonectria punicea]|uniref:Amidoligase enzyme n=1 Tax=Neonectria punicea TaxID=979145 RepID=A0ABR1GY54_9HYPO
MAASDSQNLTFGVELEFLSPAPRPHPPRGASAAAKLNIGKKMAELTKLPIALDCWHEPPETCAICSWIDRGKDGITNLLSAGNTEIRKDDQLEGTCFIVKNESLGEHQSGINEERNWPGIEIASPVFRAGELTSGLPTLTEAVNSLRDMDASITADESCGLHIHVGVEGGMTLLLAKKITTLVMILEPTMLYELVAPSRVTNACAAPMKKELVIARGFASDNSWDFDPNKSCEVMDAYLPPVAAIPAAEWNDQDPAGFHAMLKVVWESKSLQRLSALTKSSHVYRGGFFLSLRNSEGETRGPTYYNEDLEKTPSTVEFRYAQMSFDVAFISNWINVLFRVVKLAQQDASDFQKCLASIYELMDVTGQRGEHLWPVMLGEVLGLGHQSPAWRLQRQMYCRGEEISFLDSEKILLPTSSGK